MLVLRRLRRAFGRPFGAVAAFVRRFDSSDALAVVGLVCLTAGLWLVTPALALTVLGALLLTAWVFPLLVALRRG